MYQSVLERSAAALVFEGKVSATKTPSAKKTGAFESIEISDSDDFEPPVTRSGKNFGGAKRKQDSVVLSAQILSNQRAPRRPRKLSMPVEILRVPTEFRHLRSARILREFMLSKHAREKYKE